MSKYHKHLGVKSKGVLKSHPIKTNHKDKSAQRYHDVEVGKLPETIVCKQPKEVSEEPKPSKKAILATVDSDGYINLDLTECKKGLRVKFVRKEGNKKRTVGLQIER